MERASDLERDVATLADLDLRDGETLSERDLIALVALCAYRDGEVPYLIPEDWKR